MGRSRHPQHLSRREHPEVLPEEFSEFVFRPLLKLETQKLTQKEFTDLQAKTILDMTDLAIQVSEKAKNLYEMDAASRLLETLEKRTRAFTRASLRDLSKTFGMNNAARIIASAERLKAAQGALGKRAEAKQKTMEEAAMRKSMGLSDGQEESPFNLPLTMLRTDPRFETLNRNEKTLITNFLTSIMPGPEEHHVANFVMDMRIYRRVNPVLFSLFRDHLPNFMARTGPEAHGDDPLGMVSFVRPEAESIFRSHVMDPGRRSRWDTAFSMGPETIQRSAERFENRFSRPMELLRSLPSMPQFSGQRWSIKLPGTQMHVVGKILDDGSVFPSSVVRHPHTMDMDLLKLAALARPYSAVAGLEAHVDPDSLFAMNPKLLGPDTWRTNQAILAIDLANKHRMNPTLANALLFKAWTIARAAVQSPVDPDEFLRAKEILETLIPSTASFLIHVELNPDPTRPASPGSSGFSGFGAGMPDDPYDISKKAMRSGNPKDIEEEFKKAMRSGGVSSELMSRMMHRYDQAKLKATTPIELVYARNSERWMKPISKRFMGGDISPTTLHHLEFNLDAIETFSKHILQSEPTLQQRTEAQIMLSNADIMRILISLAKHGVPPKEALKGW